MSAACLELVVAKLQAREPDIVDTVLDFVLSHTAQDGVTRYCGEKHIVVDVRATKIVNGAFYQWDIVSVTFPNSLTHIGHRAFRRCQHLMSIKLPDSIVHVGDWAFYNCQFIKHVEHPKNLIYVGVAAFSRFTFVFFWSLVASHTSIP